MIIGHLPAGYITSRLLHPRLERTGVSQRAFLFWGLLGSVAPDFDMFWFHFVDHRRHGHHSYWSHYPIVWLTLLICSAIWLMAARRAARPALAMVFALGGFIHMLLDTTVGGIRWLAPFEERSYRLLRLPSSYDPWWLNFLFHWTFGLELALVAWALALLSQSRREALSR